MQLMKTIGLDSVSAKKNLAIKETTDHYNAMNEMVLFKPAFGPASIMDHHNERFI